METRRFLISCALAASFAAAAHAQSASAPAPAMPSAPVSGHLAVGVVKAVDAKNHSLTISHRTIASMGMPAMTMPFKAAPSVNITSVKKGDSIAFVLSSDAAGGVSITSLEAMPGRGAVAKASMEEDMHGMQNSSGPTMEECHDMMMKRK